jgi:hypothetical protein
MTRLTYAGRKRVTSIICLVVAASAACSAAGRGERADEKLCPGFKITEDVKISIIGGQSYRIPLGGGNFMIVPSGALTAGETREYRGNPYKWLFWNHAGLEITPVGYGHPATFSEKVKLQLNYASCKWKDNPDLVVVKTRDTGHKEEIEGTNDATGHVYTVELDSFSKFALAIN